MSCRTGLLRGGRPLRGGDTLSRWCKQLWASRWSAIYDSDQREDHSCSHHLDKLKRRANARSTRSGFLREPLQEADDAHRSGTGMRGDVLAGVDLGALRCVVAEGLDHHLLVVERGGPAELAADVRGVEDEVFGDHAVVIGAEGRDLELVSELHGR